MRTIIMPPATREHGLHELDGHAGVEHEPGLLQLRMLLLIEQSIGVNSKFFPPDYVCSNTEIAAGQSLALLRDRRCDFNTRPQG